MGYWYFSDWVEEVDAEGWLWSVLDSPRAIVIYVDRYLDIAGEIVPLVDKDV